MDDLHQFFLFPFSGPFILSVIKGIIFSILSIQVFSLFQDMECIHLILAETLSI